MKICSIKIACALLLLMSSACKVMAQHIMLLQQGKTTNIRGLSIVNDSIAWVSGSEGHVALTTNGGKTWKWQQVKGYEQSDLRAVKAFSDKEAIVMSSGTPALILKTIDGGLSWQLKYKITDTTYFFDAMDFFDKKHGFIVGDPINNKFVLLETKDKGETWHMFSNRPHAIKAEAAFAASGTCLRTVHGSLYVVTGGPVAKINILSSGNKWSYYTLPISKGQSSTGAFSVAIGKNQTIVVGGDYQHDKRSDSTACYSSRTSNKWELPQIFPAGYQSCVEFISSNTFISTGTSGTNFTVDGGKIWRKIDKIGFNVCVRAQHGKLILLAGNDGKIAIFKP